MKKAKELLNKHGLGHRKIKEVLYFKKGDDFRASYNAEEKAKAMGFTVGSMCQASPIGLACAEKYGYVAKWYNIRPDERAELSGVLLSEYFREDDVYLVVFA